ncbi:MAG: hypothetical protein EPN57_04465 [Paraburkholderia sp.]|nr:MAG: hypothetical protein EPN57_04465 [Paraburkholderia sp.]
MSVPVFDQRTAAAFFEDALALARLYNPQWGVPDAGAMTADAIAQDPGLALLKLFSLLGQDLASVVNAIPVQRQLALYRFLDMSVRPAACASAPICFSLAPNVGPVTLPKGTAVLDASTPSVRFEIDRDLQVLPATLSAVLTVVPRLDRYGDLQTLWQSGNAAPAFPGDATSEMQCAFAHCWLLGDPALFTPRGAASQMTLVLNGTRLDPEYFQRWYDGALNPLSVTVTGSADQRTCTIAFSTMPIAAAQSVTAVHAVLSAKAGRPLDMTDPFVASCPTTKLDWLVCAPAADVRVVPALNGYLPRIDSVWCDFGALSALPQQAAVNGMLVDLKNGAYAFGNTVPVLDYNFCIRSDAAFAAHNAPITMHLEVRPITNLHTAQITWQYWGGTAWMPLAGKGNPYRFVDSTCNLMLSGIVSFTCPAIAPTSVAGSQGLWIRAVLSAGDYGDLKNGFDPPFVRSLVIEYESGGVPSSIWAHNAFELDQLHTKEIEPYQPLAEEGASLYLGLKAPDLLAHGLGQQLTLYVDVDPQEEHVGYRAVGQWQWFDTSSATWQPLAINVSDTGIARSGTISFTVPAAMQAAVFFSRTACWLRVLCPRRRHALQLRGIYPNTVSASNRATYRNELLGSSNGQPGQRFVLNHISAAPPSNAQVLLAVSADSQYAVAISVVEPATADPTTLGTSEPQQQTVTYPWTRVDSFIGCAPHDRVFAVDPLAGAIVFGDGATGKIPPPGANNIFASCYAVTQGGGGNVAAGTLTALYTAAPGIAQVTNPTAARGGADADRVDDLTYSGPARVRANDRVVSAADAEALACLASAGVCRARAIEHVRWHDLAAGAGSEAAPTPAEIRKWPQLELVVLADSSEPEPLTPMAMLDDVLAYVRQRSTPALAACTTARRPAFRRIDVAVLLQTNAPKTQWPDLQATIAAQLTRFLHPAQGGATRRGWPIGDPMRYMSVYSFLGAQRSVTAVMALSLCGQTSDVALEAHESPSAGVIDLRFAEAPQR